ncbi:2-hydroxyacid dehydrogenase [Saccharopolyspora sp. K220]|uniref:2-hydroxyacid dehydrogenase n=1 Tax=Saccharopolyspora soli TaxID=2926618 RepID=UPI001F5A77FC|nr:2-hydroxyacid dehydrogenase [Saccharopolyspora soli]MCI2417325.1 2-hydroxyacid dehydrogenase [Saccharopolyspora soli]
MNNPGLHVVVAEANLVPLRAELEAALPPGTDVQWVHDATAETVEAAVATADVLISQRVSKELAAAAKRLRLVHAPGAGTEKIEVDALPPGVVVANTFHHEDAIAEHVVAASIMLRRGFLRQDTALRKGIWESPVHDRRLPWPSTLADATVGFVGFGHIGATAWERLRIFGARGVAVTRRGQADPAAGLTWVATNDELHALLAESDIVVVSAPLNAETTGLIGAAELARMGSDAVLVNIGRGPLVDEEALYNALRDGVIGGAAIDVWYQYPTGGNSAAPSRFPFHELENVLMTPHSSGIARQTFAHRVADIAANIHRFAAGEPVRNVVAGGSHE